MKIDLEHDDFDVFSFGELSEREKAICKMVMNRAENLLQQKNQEIEDWKTKYEGERATNRFLQLLLIANDIKIPYGYSSMLGEYVNDYRKNPENAQSVNNSGLRKKKSFRSIIQYSDPDGLLDKLHQKIDDNVGKDVAMVLIKAKEEGYIMRYPTQTEFEKEFPLCSSSWRAISYYFQEEKRYCVDVSSVVIF